MDRDELALHLDQLLDVSRMQDYCPNGLAVESEQHVHLARESGIAFVAAGHHATERFGV